MSDNVEVTGPTSDKDRKSKEFRVDIADNDDEAKDKDEKKDSEKPLLTGDEGSQQPAPKQIDDEELHGCIDTRGVPLPTRINKESSSDSEKPPSVLFRPLARVRYEWGRSKNLIEFFTRAVCVLFGSLGWLLLIGGAPLLSIVQLIIGGIFLNDCRAEPRIPEYLIVSGFFGTLLHGVAMCTKWVPEEKRALFEAQKRRCLCLEALLQIFLFIWFIAGCCWVYGIYEPEYQNKEHEDYCHKTLYLFSFWIFNITFMLFALLVTVGICCIACIAFAGDAENHSKQSSQVA